MKIALAQINPIVGDLSGNARLIEDAVKLAAADSPDLIVFSELVICGYPPRDLLVRDGFVEACDAAIDALAQTLKGQPAVLVGHPTTRDVPDGRMANAASLLFDGKVCLLYTSDAADE